MRLVWRCLPLILVGVMGVPRAGLAQTKAAVTQQQADAGKHYRAGVAAEKKGDLKGARQEYARAYELFQHPQVLVSLGVVEYRLGKYPAAAEHLTLFLADPPAELPARERAEYSRYLADAKKRVGTLKIFADVGAEVTVSAERVGAVPAAGSLEVFVEPGKPLVVARLGQTEGRQEVEVQAGKGSEVHLTLHAAAAPPTTVPPPAPAAGPIPEMDRDARAAANTGPARNATTSSTNAGGSATAPGTAAVVAGTAPPTRSPAAPSNRNAVLTSGVALAALGVGVSVGTGVASLVVGRDADALADKLRLDGGPGACSGVTTGNCGHLRDLRSQQSALINTAIWSAVGTAAVGVAAGIYAHVTRAEATPTTGTIVLPVVGQSAGGFAVVGTW